MSRIALLALLAAAAAPAHAGPCAMPSLAHEVATPSGTTIDQHGGVVVLTVAGLGVGIGTPTLRDGERAFRAGQLDVKASATTVAPGLVVHRVPVELRREQPELRLVDAAGTVAATVAVALRKAPPRLRGPQIRAVTASQPNRRGEGWVTATLKQAPPAGTIAVIVRDAKQRSARSFERIGDPEATEIFVYQGDRCTPRAAGTEATRGGQRIQLAWVTAAGHVSPWSAPVTVRTSPGPATP